MTVAFSTSQVVSLVISGPITATGTVSVVGITPNSDHSYLHTAGEVIAKGSLVCKSETDANILLASNVDWTRMPAFGVTAEAGIKGQEIQVVHFGKVDDIQRDADFDYDDLVFVGVDGKATNVAPSTIVQSIGRAKNASDVILLINQTAVEID